jgi:FtsP/CotA-like multicopper oxidase with cupredoxin domain
LADPSEVLATRRNFVAKVAASSGLLLAGCDSVRKLQNKFTQHPADHLHSPDAAEHTTRADLTLRIGSVVAEIAKDHAISTIAYNGSVPGPLIRLPEGSPVTVDLINETDFPELVHWHGLIVPADVDGADEENSLVVPAHGSIRYALTPTPSGSRFVHSHSMPMADLSRGSYTGQFGFVYVEPRLNPGSFDQEIFLATHEWEPFFTTEEMADPDEPAPVPPPSYKKDDKANGWEIGYQRFTMNGKCLGHGEPVRVKQGQRVLFHFLNASATENIKLALPGHRFQVTGLDGNPVPKPQLVDVIELGTAERVDAIVEMNNAGVWILGTPKNDDRVNGLGIVIEYANKTGAPVWTAPPKSAWSYSLFGDVRPPEMPDETIPLVFGKVNGGAGGFNFWTINGKSFENKDRPHTLHRDRRYRFVFDNQTDDAHPVHLHRASFTVVKVNGRDVGGIVKDVVLVKGFGKVEVDVVPTIAGLSLFHCHQQLHMDFGFKLLFNVV